MTETTNNHANEEFHVLSDKWTLWAHLPHDTDWSMKSYKKIYTFRHVEEVIAVSETIPNILVENCMLFLMRDSIKPMWEDERNRKGGSFSYKITKNISSVWKNLVYVVSGGTVSKQNEFVNSVTGISISPKKNFCIIKIWMTNRLYQNPTAITILSPSGCLFKKHEPEH
jgi:hypothetical protein